MTISYERAKLLIDVIKGVAELGPREGNSIGTLAVAELRAMDAEAREKVAAAVAEAKAKAAAEAAEAAAKAKAAADATAADEEAAESLRMQPRQPVAPVRATLPDAPAGRRV
jgi:type IV secretory pathway TrbL component